MGCAVSASRDKEAQERSKKIDARLRLDAERQAAEVKLLLLGECTKNFFFLVVRYLIYWSITIFIICVVDQLMGNLFDVFFFRLNCCEWIRKIIKQKSHAVTKQKKHLNHLCGENMRKYFLIPFFIGKIGWVFLFAIYIVGPIRLRFYNIALQCRVLFFFSSGKFFLLVFVDRSSPGCFHKYLH